MGGGAMKRFVVVGVVFIVAVAVSSVFAGDPERRQAQDQLQQQLRDGNCDCVCDCYCDGPNCECDCLQSKCSYKFHWWNEYSGGRETLQSGPVGPPDEDWDWIMFMAQYCFRGGE
jgi:hypothetical protein